MIRIILIAALITLLIVIFQVPKKASRSSVAQPKRLNPRRLPRRKTYASLESILIQQLGSKSLNERYPNKTRVVVAHLETSRLALAKESECGPMIVLNRNDERSETIYKFLLTRSPKVLEFLSVLSHKQNFKNKIVNEALSLVYTEIIPKPDQI